MPNIERQTVKNVPVIFREIDSLINDLPYVGFESCYFIDGQIAGLIGNAEDLYPRNKRLAREYYWKIFLYGYKYFITIMDMKEQGKEPLPIDQEIIERTFKGVFECGKFLTHDIWKRSDPSPKNRKSWTRLGELLNKYEVLCKTFLPRELPKMINRWSIYERSNVLYISQDKPIESLQKLDNLEEWLLQAIDEYEVDSNDLDSIPIPADFLNNLGVIYTDKAYLFLDDLLFSKKDFEKSDQKCLQNIKHAQEAFRSAIRLLENSGYINDHNYQIRRLRTQSNLAFTYIIDAHYLLEVSPECSLSNIVFCIQKFKKHYSDAQGAYVTAAQTKDVHEFDAETYRRMIDLLLLFLYTRLVFNEVDIDYINEEQEVIEKVIEEDERYEYALNPKSFLTKKIDGYMNNAYDYIEKHKNTKDRMEFDDRELLKQSAERFIRLGRD